MKFKGTAGLLALLVVLAAWVYFTDIRGAEERERAAEEAGLALPIDADSILRLRLIYPDNVIEGVRANGAWEFVSPAGLEADRNAWDLLASNVPRVERGETISLSEEEMDLSAFGLDAPSLEVELELDDGSVESIRFGRENPGGTDFYAMLASAGDVFLAPRSWMSTLSKEVNDLRDKSVLHFDQMAIDRVEISGTVQRSLRKDGEDWILETPLHSPAARAEIDTFLAGLAATRATGFGDFGDDVAALDRAGLNRPRLRLVLHDGMSDQDDVLLIGSNPAEEAGSYYAKDASRDTIFVIDGDIVENAEQPVFDWRDKTLATFDRPTISSVEFERDDENWIVSMGDSGWELPEGPVRGEAMSLMFNAVEFERATDIIDNPGPLASYGLTTPRLRVVFEAGAEPVLAFGFGQETPGGDGFYWKSEAETAVKVVPRVVFDRFNLTPDELLAAEESSADPADP